MLTGIGLLVILGIVTYLVVLPLIRREVQIDKPFDPDLTEDTLEKTKEAVFTSINEIEFDYKMKKLSEEDYQHLKEQYKQKALELLHEEDEMELETDDVPAVQTKVEAELVEEIERELEALRQQRTVSETP